MPMSFLCFFAALLALGFMPAVRSARYVLLLPTPQARRLILGDLVALLILFVVSIVAVLIWYGSA